jgi:protein dithiol oxidoreductase (disulfide-forming)
MIRSAVLGRWLAVLLLTAPVFAASAADPVEGRDYTVIAPTLPVADPQKVVVTEFFSYACPHCFGFAPALKLWEGSKPSDVVLDRVAVSLGRQAWVLPAAIYYTLRGLGKDKELDEALFKAIHVDRVNLFAVEPAVDWVAAQGVDRARFFATLTSFGTEAFIQRGDNLSAAVQLRGIPALVIDGKYMVMINDSGDLVAQMAVVDSLIARVRRERALPSP